MHTTKRYGGRIAVAVLNIIMLPFLGRAQVHNSVTTHRVTPRRGPTFHGRGHENNDTPTVLKAETLALYKNPTERAAEDLERRVADWLESSGIGQSLDDHIREAGDAILTYRIPAKQWARIAVFYGFDPEIAPPSNKLTRATLDYWQQSGGIVNMLRTPRNNRQACSGCGVCESWYLTMVAAVIGCADACPPCCAAALIAYGQWSAACALCHQQGDSCSWCRLLPLLESGQEVVYRWS